MSFEDFKAKLRIQLYGIISQLILQKKKKTLFVSGLNWFSDVNSWNWQVRSHECVILQSSSSLTFSVADITSISLPLSLHQPLLSPNPPLRRCHACTRLLIPHLQAVTPFSPLYGNVTVFFLYYIFMLFYNTTIQWTCDYILATTRKKYWIVFFF